MKKYLPKSINSSGFTLIELLVVIVIIAVLSVIAFAVYSGIQPKARNDTRRADLDAIAKAFEVNKTPAGYASLATTQFANGIIPQLDPQGYVYCGNTDATIPAGGLTAASTASACTPTGAANYSPVSATVPPGGGTATAWKVCTWLEAETNPTVAAKTFCRGSAQ